MRVFGAIVAAIILVVLAFLAGVCGRPDHEAEPSEPCCAIARLRAAGVGTDDQSVIKALCDSHPKVRAAALDIMAKRRLSLPASLARELVADPFPPVRERAVFVLRLHSDSPAAPYPGTDVASSVLWELAGCLPGSPSGYREPRDGILQGIPTETVATSVEILSDLFMEGRPAQWWLQHDCRSLGDVDRPTMSCLRNAPDRVSLRILQQVLKNPNTSTETKSTATWVAKSILTGGTQERALDPLARIDSLVGLPEHEVRKRLCESARHALVENGDCSIDAIRNLGFCGSPDDVMTLANYVESPDAARTEYAALALWKLTGEFFVVCQMDDQAARRRAADAWRSRGAHK